MAKKQEKNANLEFITIRVDACYNSSASAILTDCEEMRNGSDLVSFHSLGKSEKQCICIYQPLSVINAVKDKFFERSFCSSNDGSFVLNNGIVDLTNVVKNSASNTQTSSKIDELEKTIAEKDAKIEALEKDLASLLAK